MQTDARDEFFVRVDVIVVPYRNLPVAQFFFTGNGLLCRRLRSKAMGMGLRLNEKALSNCKDGELVEVHSERHLFELLGEKCSAKPEDRELVEGNRSGALHRLETGRDRGDTRGFQSSGAAAGAFDDDALGSDAAAVAQQDEMAEAHRIRVGGREMSAGDRRSLQQRNKLLALGHQAS